MVYLVHWNMGTGFRLIAKVHRDHADRFRELVEEYEFMEVGPITYWLFSHNFPKLAMLPFWR